MKVKLQLLKRHTAALKEMTKLLGNTKLKLEFNIKATLPKPETDVFSNYDFL